MKKPDSLEVWLRGPVDGIPPLLQPVAHALLQARDEVQALMEGFPEEKLWDRPAGLASPGYHLQHLSGVLDRMLTYAKGQALTNLQLKELEAEGSPRSVAPGSAVPDLVARFSLQVDKALQQLSETPESSLTEPRGVGRAGLPSTVIGLLVHGAEHTQRHNGQLLVTVRVLHSPVR
jgi:hypothetical protein